MGSSLKYFYDFMSQPSRALYIVLKLSGTPYESCPVALGKGEHLSKTFKNDVNRFQKVPCIVDNGFQLAESVAILRYLDNKGQVKPELYPKDTHKRAKIDEVLEWQHTTIRLGCGLYFRTKYLEPFLSGKEPNSEKVKEWEKVMRINLDITENMLLNSSEYIAGDTLTVADIFASCEIEQPRIAGYDPVKDYPKIGEWLQRIRLATNPHYDVSHKLVYKIAKKAGLQLKL